MYASVVFCSWGSSHLKALCLSVFDKLDKKDCYVNDITIIVMCVTIDFTYVEIVFLYSQNLCHLVLAHKVQIVLSSRCAYVVIC